MHELMSLYWIYKMQLVTNGWPLEPVALVFANWDWGLTKEAAGKKWELDFNKLEKEQREGNDLDGRSTGLVAWLAWLGCFSSGQAVFNVCIVASSNCKGDGQWCHDLHLAAPFNTCTHNAAVRKVRCVRIWIGTWIHTAHQYICIVSLSIHCPMLHKLAWWFSLC